MSLLPQNPEKPNLQRGQKFLRDASSLGAAVLPITSNEGIRRAVMTQVRFPLCRQFRGNPIGKHFAQFHPPLIEGIQVPDGPLHEHFMFIQGNQFSQHGRSQFICQEGVQWDDCRQTFDGELRLTKPPQPPPPWLFCRRRAPRSGPKKFAMSRSWCNP